MTDLPLHVMKPIKIKLGKSGWSIRIRHENKLPPRRSLVRALWSLKATVGLGDRAS